MTSIFVAQLLLPVILVLWMALAPPRSRVHIHAQRPGPPGAPVGGEPLPITLGGRFVVRGERIELP